MSEVDLSVFTHPDKDAPLFLADTNGNEVITVEAGREYRLYYYFKGYSSDETLDYDVALAINGNMIGLSSEETDNHKGYYQYYYWNLSLQSGTYTITVNLDPNNKIAESNEKNNSYSITITVPGYSNYLMDTFWSQNGYFLGYNELEINAYCPVEPGQNEHSVTGCSNTAASQILYYFAKKGNQFTLQLDDNDKNTANSSITIDASSSNAKRYDYLSFSEVNKKLEEFDVDSAEDVAALIFASGVIAESDYGASLTSTYTSNIKTVFERAGFYGIKTAYQNSELLDKNGVITDEGWEIIKSNIAAGKPVYTSIPKPSHAVVIDGYDRNTDSVHINFGWGFWGSKNDASGYAHPTGSGWYTRSECEEMKISALIYDITPDETAPVIKLSKTAPADNKVVITANFSDNVEVYGKYYQIGSTSGQWLEYNGPLTVTKNCTVYFKAVDKAKNETISNIKVNGLFEVITGHVVKDGEIFTATEYVTAENFTVNTGGQLIIASNGVATGIKENGGFVQINSQAATVTFSANTFGNMTISSKCSLHTGTVANATTLAGTAGMYIYSGGKADKTIVDGGYIYIYSGGKADNTTLKNSGTVNVHTGGEANYTNIIGGYINIDSGAVANNTTLGAAGYINIKGGTANYTTVNEYGFIELINGGIVNNTTLNKSYLAIQNGCTANNTVINAGEMMVYSNGTAKNTTLNAGSHMDIRAGGKATGIKENGGFIEFDENAEVSFTANKFGNMSIMSKCSLHDQTTAGDLTVNSGGEVYIYDGGKVQDTLIDGGNVYIYSGGKAENSVITRGNLYIYSGGTHSGTLESASAVNTGIHVEKGGIINLDISGRSVDDDCLINAGIYGSPTYCITVDANQAYGEYKLVRQSSLENSTITINCGSAIYGTITIDRYNNDQINKISHDGINYIVSKKNGSLYLKINAIAPPDKPLAILSTNDPTTKPVTVSAVFDEKSVRNEYSYDGINWGTYASKFTFSNNTTIYFRSVNADGDYSDVTVCEINNIDNVKPTGSGTVNGSVKDNNIAVFDWSGIFNDNESGISHYNIKLISGKSLNTLQEFTTTDASFSQKLADGKYYLHVQAVDKAGNTGESIGSNAISIETGPPATPENLSISNDGKKITLNWSAVNDLDLNRYVLQISGNKDFSVILEEKELYKTSFLCDLDDGEYYFRITAVDHTGNHAQWSEVISISLDNTPPEVPTIKADITGMTNKTVTVSADFSDDSIIRQYSFDNQNWKEYTSAILFEENGIVYFRGQDAAGNYSDISMYEVDNIEKVSDRPQTDYIFINSKFTGKKKVNGKKQNGIALVYGVNAFASIEAAGDTAGKNVILLDSKNSGDYSGLDVVAGNVVIPTIKENENSYSYKASSTPKGAVTISAGKDAKNTDLLRFATVNIDGAEIGNVTGGKESATNDIKTSTAPKGTVTDTEKSNYSANASGKFTANNASTGIVTGYSTVNLNGGNISELAGGNVKNSISKKLVSGKNKDQKTISTVDEFSAAGSVTIKNNTIAGNINGFSNVTITGANAGNITNLTSKDSKNEASTYDHNEKKQTVTRKVTLNHTEKTSGTLKATGITSLGNVTGFATVLLRNVSSAGNFRRVDGDGGNYCSRKETLNIKTAKDVSVSGTYTENNTFTRAGKFTAADSVVQTIENFSNVTLTRVQAQKISNITYDKCNASYNLFWENAGVYGTPKDYSVDFVKTDDDLISYLEQHSANGSATLDNSIVTALEGFNSVNIKNNSTVSNSVAAMKAIDGKETFYGSWKLQISNKLTEKSGIYYSGTYTKTTTAAPAVSIKVKDSVIRGNILGYRNVTLNNAETGSVDFGEAYTEKYTLTYKNGIKSEKNIKTYVCNGSLNASGTTVNGNITGYSKVTLTTSEAQIITQNTLVKVSGTEENHKLSGSVALKNSTVSAISNFRSMTMTGSTIKNSVCNVNKITVNKGDNFIGNFSGSDGNDSFTIAKGAILTTGNICLGCETKDTITINGTLILTGSMLEAAKITGKGEIAAVDSVYNTLDIEFANILNLGEKADNFRGTAYEKADNDWKKAVKWDGEEKYCGWLGNWSGYTDGNDSIDYIRFSADAGETLLVEEISCDSWVLLDKRGVEIEDENIFADGKFLAAGDYIIKLESDKNIAYSITLGLA